MLRRLFSLGLVPVALGGCVLLRSTDPIDRGSLPPFNQLVLDVAAEYPADGTHDYWWPKRGEGHYDGCSRDMQLGGVTVMSGEPRGRTYCCGFTLEIFLEALNRWRREHPGAAPQLTPEEWPRFQRLWFVEDINGPGPSAALEAYGIGGTIASDELVAGDFVQLWRTETDTGKLSGHSVIFLGWVRDWRGEAAGMRYFSTQPKTDGIGEATELFGGDGGLSRRFCHFGRVEIADRE